MNELAPGADERATVRVWLATVLAILAVAEVVGILLFASIGDARFPIGGDMIAAGVGLGLALLTSGYAVTGMPPAPARPLALQVLVVSQLLFVPSIASGTILLILHFPSDRLPGPRLQGSTVIR